MSNYKKYSKRDLEMYVDGKLREVGKELNRTFDRVRSRLAEIEEDIRRLKKKK